MKQYCLLILTSAHAVRPEYYSVYPDLRVSYLANLSSDELRSKHLSGYAVCSTTSDYWTIDKIRVLSSQDTIAVNEYVNLLMNARRK